MAFWWWIAQHAATTALAILGVLAVCRLVPHRPALMHVLWVALLLKFVVPPLVSWPWAAPGAALLNSVTTEPTLTAQRTFDEPGRSSAPSEQLRELSLKASVEPAWNEIEPVVVLEAEDPNAPTSGESLSMDSHQAVRTEFVTIAEQPSAPLPGASQWDAAAWRAALVAASVWVFGSILALLRQVRRMMRLARLVRRATAAPSRLEAEVATAAGALGMRPVSIVVSDVAETPFIWCWGPALLVWPASLADEASVARLAGVVAHELAHVRRRDHWLVWFDLAVGIAWWFHPLAWFVRRRLHEAAEAACDACALQVLPEHRLAYAESLLEFSTVRSHAAAAALGAGSRDCRTLERRLKMILNRRTLSGLSWRGWLGAAVFAVVLLPNWGLSFAEPPGDEPAATSNDAADDPEPASDDAPAETADSAEAAEAGEPASPATVSAAEPIEDPVEPAIPLPLPAERLGLKLRELIAETHQLAAERASLEAQLKALHQQLEKREAMIADMQAALRKIKQSRAPVTEESVEFELKSDRPDNRLALQLSGAARAARDVEIETTVVAGGEPSDALTLGLALVEARGQLALAREEYKGLIESHEKSPGSVTQKSIRAAAIQVDTAQAKLKLLHLIAGTARETACAELSAAEKQFARIKKLVEENVVPADELPRAEGRLRGLMSRIKLLEVIRAE